MSASASRSISHGSLEVSGSFADLPGSPRRCLRFSSGSKAPVSFLRCCLSWGGGLQEEMVPVEGCELRPVLLIKDTRGALVNDEALQLGGGSPCVSEWVHLAEAERRSSSADVEGAAGSALLASGDAPGGPPPYPCRVLYRWQRGPPRAVCALHPHREAKLQCVASLRCFCGYRCFSAGMQQLRRFFLSGGLSPLPSHPNPCTYGAPCRPFSWHDIDEERETDVQHLALLTQAGLVDVVDPRGLAGGGAPRGAPKGAPSKGIAGSEQPWHEFSTGKVIPVSAPPSAVHEEDEEGEVEEEWGAPRGPPPRQSHAKGWSVVSYEKNYAPEPGDAGHQLQFEALIVTDEVLLEFELAQRQQRLRAKGRAPRHHSQPGEGAPDEQTDDGEADFGRLSIFDWAPRDSSFYRCIRTAFCLPKVGAPKPRRRWLMPPSSRHHPRPIGEGPLERMRSRQFLSKGPLPRSLLPKLDDIVQGMLCEGMNPAAFPWLRSSRGPPQGCLPGEELGGTSELYSTVAAFPHCEAYALSWPYRKQRIIQEILTHKPDIVCLQEVEREHYEDFFLPQLAAEGYAGVYKQKTAEIFAASSSSQRGGGRFTMDGCASFYLMHNTPARGKDGPPKRLLKDNIALLLLFELKTDATAHSQESQEQRPEQSHGGSELQREPKLLLLANTHVAANPDSNDVKIWQTQTLLGALDSYLSCFPSRPPALLLCGDFNSSPDSAVYRLLLTGACDEQHQDFAADANGILRDCHIGHSLMLSSAYALGKALRENLDPYDFEVSQQCEPPFTNYTGNFTGCLDYIFFSASELRLAALMEPVSETQLFMEAETLHLRSAALPSPLRPSDHVPLIAEFDWIEDPLTANPLQSSTPLDVIH
ncbi:endonuclease exonuclease phosphatase family protein [Cyclospora cayetanensis]|uniref:Endonuclease exonuclease phosphatase family protein n=1 Tax=Cyclospora cayetanensis TaxID=88456 RepID=A0A1D3D0X3_9EIME|nr:endonuclease exonuclease phosphatase family protein [Cyclospora cayetanensis]